MRTQDRVIWVDIAKAIAILLVALNHSALLGSQVGLSNPDWVDWNTMLAASRMPLFFFASGLFAGSIVQRSWGRLWSSRLALLAWMFLLWTAIRFVYFTALPMDARPQETSIAYLILSPVWPTSGLWFLHALLLFFLITKLTLRLPKWLMLAGATVLSVSFLSFAGVGNIGYNGMARYYLFFLLGLYLKDGVLRLNANVRPVVTVLVLILLTASTVTIFFWNLSTIPGVMVLLGLIAVTGGALLARALAATPLRRPLAYLGSQTLPVYVSHVILLAFGWHLVGSWFGSVNEFYAIALPVILVAVVVPVGLLIARVVRGVPVLRYLFEAPPFFRRATRESSRQVDASANK